MKINIANIYETDSRFQVLQTTKRSQTAVMTLAPGTSSSEKANVHAHSDQILYVVKGRVEAEVEAETRQLKEGDICLVPAGTPHRFENRGAEPVITFSVYAPPEYPADEKD
jgi:mannose-6-phosphate isomerase-like protein (cupin superfamily)